MPYPGLLHPDPLPLQQATADLYLLRRHSNTILTQSSLWGLGVSWSWCTQGLFEPSEHLWHIKLKSDRLYSLKPKMQKLYTVIKKQDQELPVAQIMNSLL